MKDISFLILTWFIELNTYDVDVIQFDDVFDFSVETVDVFSVVLAIEYMDLLWYGEYYQLIG